MKIACIIPARGGSKGVPRKNIKLLGGIPLIHWSIISAKKSEALSVVAVSSEDKEIQDIAREGGAEIIVRPMEMAQDNTKSEPVIKHGLQYLEEKEKYDGVLLLSPTNPFRDPKYIKQAVSLFEMGKYDTVVGLTPVYKYQYKVEEGDYIAPLWSERQNRQQRKPIWMENGSMYLCRSSLAREGKIFGEKIGYVEMDELAAINIDSPADFIYAEAIVKAGMFKL